MELFRSTPNSNDPNVPEVFDSENISISIRALLRPALGPTFASAGLRPFAASSDDALPLSATTTMPSSLYVPFLLGGMILTVSPSVLSPSSSLTVP